MKVKAEFSLDELDFSYRHESGEDLIPVILQNQHSGEVLTLAFANREAVLKTLETSHAHFYSRSRKELWKKGATSGHFQEVSRVVLDCDNDALIYFVEKQHGPACHAGNNSCFGDSKNNLGAIGWLSDLEVIIKERINTKAENSYVADLARKGLPKIAQKVGEESTEVIIAALVETKEQFIGESADLLFHLMVLLQAKGYSLADVINILQERHMRKTQGD